MKKTAIATVSVGLVILVAWLALDQLTGRPMSSDLSQVGQGQPAIVLAFENYSPASMEAMDRLNRIREDHEPAILFLAADLGTPEGRAFSSDFALPAGSAILLDSAGSPVRSYSLLSATWSLDLDEDLRQLP